MRRLPWVLRAVGSVLLAAAVIIVEMSFTGNYFDGETVDDYFWGSVVVFSSVPVAGCGLVLWVFSFVIPRTFRYRFSAKPE